MNKRNTAILSLAALVTACTREKPSVALEKPASPQATSQQLSANQEATDSMAYDGGPPFADTCLCNFNAIGHIKTSKKRYDLFISGTGWNPKLTSCNWIWGELVANEIPTDTLITDFRIHLINLDEFKTSPKPAFLNSNSFREKLILTYLREGQKDTVIYNSNQEGN